MDCSQKLYPKCIPIIFCLGDEIFNVNGTTLSGLSHGEAIGVFKNIRMGPVILQVGRRPGQSLLQPLVKNKENTKQKLVE
jgi:hypothetical protein